MTYFNTNGLSGRELEDANDKTLFQRDYILKIFKEFPRVSFTPFEVKVKLRSLYSKRYPITSIRARMSTLTKEGLLIKSDKAYAKGIYSTKNHAWKLNVQDKVEEIAA